MKIGNLEIKGFASLAPMAGVADRAMREICREFGAAYTVSELVSAKGVSLHDKKSRQLLYVSDSERPMGSQLFGSEPETLAAAAVSAMEFNPDFIDINMGCPAPKVANNGCGSALMKNPEKAAKIVETVKRAVDVPVTVKIRSGWDSEHINAVEVAKLCESAGADAITVHGRTRAQMYAPSVDLSIIKKVKEAVSVPVIGNGDVVDIKSAKRMYDETGCDFIMIGRGACGKPWLFAQINAFFERGEIMPEPNIEERLKILLKQVSKMIEYKGERIAINESRKHAAFYMKGLKNAAGYRRQCGTISSLSELEKLCETVAKENRV
jgi:tRNA-dihydrouridine synthase B